MKWKICKPGQSVRGVVRVRTPSKEPAHLSLAVKGAFVRWNSLLTVAEMEECSYCEVDVGPVAPCTTAMNHKYY